jgi:hypothetical protein
MHIDFATQKRIRKILGSQDPEQLSLVRIRIRLGYGSFLIVDTSTSNKFLVELLWPGPKSVFLQNTRFYQKFWILYIDPDPYLKYLATCPNCLTLPHWENSTYLLTFSSVFHSLKGSWKALPVVLQCPQTRHLVFLEQALSQIDRGVEPI